VFGAAVEDYLKVIYELSLENERVAPSAVAEAQDVSLAAVTKMVKRLGDLRLVTYDRHAGIKLTATGTRVALEMIRHHRLIELYLKEALGYSWDEVDAEAEKLEHVISEEFEDRIDRVLGHPTHDPHGAPIPTKDGKIDGTRHPALADLEPGHQGTVERVSDHDPAMLRHLAEIGVYPETWIELLGREPFGGSFLVRVDGTKRSVGEELARNVFISKGRGPTPEREPRVGGDNRTGKGARGNE
jgi:DtxR family Mn-dependent transcriptional regulator